MVATMVRLLQKLTPRLRLAILAGGVGGIVLVAALVLRTELKPKVALAVDSAMSTAEALQRFRSGMAPVTGLEGGFGSVEALIGRYLEALAAGDLRAAAKLIITPAEFAYLYYPNSREAAPPYELDPGLVWLRLTSESEKGLRQAANFLMGRRPHLVEYGCERQERFHEVTTFSRCTVTLTDGTDTLKVRLFGSILEHRGQFKFLTLANSL